VHLLTASLHWQLFSFQVSDSSVSERQRYELFAPKVWFGPATKRCDYFFSRKFMYDVILIISPSFNLIPAGA
jgi:hypothetical protein